MYLYFATFFSKWAVWKYWYLFDKYFRANVLSGHHFLHHIQAKEFLDSPEFESSRTGVEEKFKVKKQMLSSNNNFYYELLIRVVLLKLLYLNFSFKYFFFINCPTDPQGFRSCLEKEKNNALKKSYDWDFN